MSTAIYGIREMEELIKIEVDLINFSFEISSEAGQAALNNSLASFVEFLTSKKGSFVKALDLDYRRFVVGLLMGIENKNHHAAMLHLFFPASKC